MSVSTDDVIEVVSFGLWWPDGEPGELRERARAWRTMAAALAAAHHELLSAAEEVRRRNDGAAIDAYADHAARLRDHLLDVADACQSLARDLDSFADELDEARRQVMQMAAEIAATVAVGIGLAVLTAGLSAGASAAVTTAMVARAGLLARLVGQRAVEIAARTAATAAIGATEGAAADLLVQTVPQLTFTDNANPFDQVDLDLHQLGIATAGGGILGGVFGGVQALRHPPVPRVRRPGLSPDGELPLTRPFPEAQQWTTSRRSPTPAQNAERHFADHGADFAASSLEEYVAAARTFFGDPPPGTLTRQRQSGDIVRYHPDSNTFGVMDAQGTPRTFFKPDVEEHGFPTNLEYFHGCG